MKKIILLVLSLTLVVTIEVNAEESISVEEKSITQEDTVDYEKLSEEELSRIAYSQALELYEQDKAEREALATSTVGTRGPIGPEEGYFDLNETGHYSGGGPYTRDSETGVYNEIKSLSLYIAGKATRGVSTVVLAVAQQIGDMNIDGTLGATAKLMESYSYTIMEGRIFTNGSWKNYVECHKEYSWLHYYATYKNTLGMTRQDIKDFTLGEGYSPIDTNPSTHYNDSSWISQKAHEGYSINFVFREYVY